MYFNFNLLCKEVEKEKIMKKSNQDEKAFWQSLLLNYFNFPCDRICYTVNFLRKMLTVTDKTQNSNFFQSCYLSFVDQLRVFDSQLLENEENQD